MPITMIRTPHFVVLHASAGVYRLGDKNKNPISTPNYPDDYFLTTNLAPKAYSGLQNSFSFKGFELSFLLQFVKQVGQNYDFGNYVGPFYGPGLIGNQPTTVLNRWQ